MSTVVEQQKGTRQTIKSAAAAGVMTVFAWLVLGTGLFAAAFAVMGQLDTAVPVALASEAPASSTSIVPCVEG